MIDAEVIVNWDRARATILDEDELSFEVDYWLEDTCTTPGIREKDRSPNFDLSRGVTYVDSAYHSPDRVVLPTTDRTQSDMYAGHLPTWMECMIEHNLNCIRYRIGNQCNWIWPGVTWSRMLSSRMRRTAAFRTLLNGSSVACGRPASMELQ